MMTLLEQALNAIQNQIDDNADNWFDKLIDELNELIKTAADNELRLGGLQALDILIKNRAKFVNLGKKSFLLFMTYTAAGRSDDAAKEYYRSSASPREIIDAILDDAVDLEKIYREKEELKKEALELAKLLFTGARLLLPLLLTLL